MYAQSLLGSVRRLTLRSKYLLNQRQLNADSLIATGRQFLTTLSTVDALIVEATPLPVLVPGDDYTTLSRSDSVTLEVNVSDYTKSNKDTSDMTDDTESRKYNKTNVDLDKITQEIPSGEQQNMMDSNHISDINTIVSSYDNSDERNNDSGDDTTASAHSGVSTAPSKRDEGLIATLAAHLSMNGSLRIKALNESIKQRARRSRRVHTSPMNSQFRIPLTDDGPGAHNWRPVIRTLIDRFDTLVPLCEQVISRLYDVSPESVATRLWRSAVDTLSEMRTVLKIHLAKQERLRRLYDRPSRQPAEFAVQTVNQLTGIDVRTDQ